MSFEFQITINIVHPSTIMSLSKCPSYCQFTIPGNIVRITELYKISSCQSIIQLVSLSLSLLCKRIRVRKRMQQTQSTQSDIRQHNIQVNTSWERRTETERADNNFQLQKTILTYNECDKRALYIQALMSALTQVSTST